MTRTVYLTTSQIIIHVFIEGCTILGIFLTGDSGVSDSNSAAFIVAVSQVDKSIVVGIQGVVGDNCAKI